MEAITFTLNGQTISAREGQTILEVARQRGIEIPTLCHHDLLRSVGACRLCQVEDEKRGMVVPSCVTKIQPDMVISTHSERVVRNRRNILRLLMAAHPESCLVCGKGNLCELRSLAAQHGISQHGLDPMPYHPGVIDLNPNLVRDLSKCILCAKCIRADQEIVVEGVLDYNKRGFEAHPATLFMDSLEGAQCTFCGTCLSVCPVGAIQEKNRPRLDHGGQKGQSVCSFCACGCSISIEHQNGNFRGVSPTALPSTANGISLCVKGHFGHDFLLSPERLTTPLVKTGQGFAPLGWDQALDLMAERLGGIARADGGSALGFLGGSRSTLEEAYLFRRLAREVFGSENLDCTADTWGRAAAALRDLAGQSAATGSLKDLETSEVVLVVGVDPTRSAPVLGYHLKRAARFGGKKLIVVDPLASKLAPLAEVWLRPKLAAEGTVLMGLAKVIIEEGLLKVAAETAGYESFLSGLKKASVAQCAALAGLEEADLRRTARLLASAESSFIVFGEGLAHCTNGAEVAGLVVALSLMTSSGWMPVLPDCNTQGALDLQIWPGEKGLDWAGMLAAAGQASLKGIYVLAHDPVGRASQPEEAAAALARLEFLVVQDLFVTETAQLAHLVLPAASLAEKEGTVTSLERRVQRFGQALIPPGDFPPEWKFLTELAVRRGQPWDYTSPSQVWAEILDRVPAYAPLAELEGDRTTFLSPFNLERVAFPAAPRLNGAGIPEAKGYPLVLVSGPTLEHLGSGSRTSRSRRLSLLAPEGFFGLGMELMASLDLHEGDRVRACSARGALEGPVRRDERLGAGLVFAPMSFPGWRPACLGPSPCRVRLEKI